MLKKVVMLKSVFVLQKPIEEKYEGYFRKTNTLNRYFKSII